MVTAWRRVNSGYSSCHPGYSALASLVATIDFASSMIAIQMTVLRTRLR
jgi:hypothetical protein